jgi:hypothetical protein
MFKKVDLVAVSLDTVYNGGSLSKYTIGVFKMSNVFSYIQYVGRCQKIY